MKYIVILGDGMSDYPLKELDNKTPLEVANKPNIDKLASLGEIGLVQTIPKGMLPGSDIANLAVMGYDPLKYYTGRSPLEAISMGIILKDNDIAIRANLVTLSDEKEYKDKTMIDYSAGEISSDEARELINYINNKLGNNKLTFYAGVSYRHCLIKSNTTIGSDLTPPHDISDKIISDYLPKGLNGKEFATLMQESYNLLSQHPVNIKRIEKGLKPANSIWLWGEGVKPNLPLFENEYGVKGAVISAVDLLKGIGIASGMKSYDVDGATGTIDTNFEGKADTCIEALKDGADFVYLHFEAPDECSHQGDVKGKIKAIEYIDKKVVARLLNNLNDIGEDYSILVLPDHPTPLSTRTHASDPVPYLLYQSNKLLNNKYKSYNEKNAQNSGIMIASGTMLMQKFINKEI